jgi:hypothetical protein
MANGSIKNMLREMTEEELNKIITATYDGAWRGARDAVNFAIAAIVRAVIFIGFLIWLCWYGGFPIVFSIVMKLIYVITTMLSALPKDTFAYLSLTIFGYFILAILLDLGKKYYKANRNRKKAQEWHVTPTPKEWPPTQEWHVTPTPKEWPPNKVDAEKLKKWREYK